eukprot:g4062.t1
MAALEKLVEELRESFVLLGQHDGDEITVETARKKLIELGYEKTDQEIKQLLMSMSEKSDGSRAIFEHCFRNVQEKLEYADDTLTINDALKVVDKFGTGSISAAELRHLLFCEKEKHGLTVEQIDQILKLCGKTKDGMINSKALVNLMHN